MLAGFLIFNAVVGAALAAVVLRAAPARAENRWLAAVGGIDAALMAVLGATVAAGHPMDDELSRFLCTIGRILICYPALRFAYVFPFSDRPPRGLRWALLASSAAGLALLLYPGHLWFRPACLIGFFQLVFLLTVAPLVRNMRRLPGSASGAAGVRTILGAVIARFVLEHLVWNVIRPLGRHSTFEVALLLDNTIVVLASYVVIAYAILRHQLFRVRGVLADLALYGGSAVLVLGLVGLLVEVVLDHVAAPAPLRLALVGVSAVPLLAVFVLRQMAPRLETHLLWSIDPRRAERHRTLEGVLSRSAAMVDPAALLGLAREALIAITGGGGARFLIGPALAEVGAPSGGDGRLPPSLAAALANSSAHHIVQRGADALGETTRADLSAAGGELIVAVRAGSRLYGALVVEGGTLDRDTLLTADALAGHLASRLETSLLVRELEDARRLAALGGFAAAIAHDIRTPLTSAQMNVQMLAGKLDVSASDRESFDIALDELKRLDQHVAELLDFAKPLAMSPIAVDLRTVAEDAARRLERTLADRKLTLEQRHDGDLPLIKGDPQRLGQVLVNLVDNAADASPSGGAVLIATRPGPGATVALDVRDGGKGIAPEHLPRIFEPFFTTRADGTGLGLAIVLKVVKAHGGEIDVRSRPGEGTTFTVLLPAAGAGG